jgi:DNA-binding NtrC family response regulator
MKGFPMDGSNAEDTSFSVPIMEMPRVVIVDDDQGILTSLRQLIELSEETYRLHTFDKPLEALSFVRANEVDLVLSDFLMPEMDGMKLLHEVRILRPEVTRIILTGYADKENAIRGVNEARLYALLEKPFDNDDLLIKLRNGLERTMLIRNMERALRRAKMAESERENFHNRILELLA